MADLAAEPGKPKSQSELLNGQRSGQEKGSPGTTPPQPPVSKNIQDVKDAVNDNSITGLEGVLDCVEKMPPDSVFKLVFQLWEKTGKQTFGKRILQWGEDSHKFLVLRQAAHMATVSTDAEAICTTILAQSPDVIYEKWERSQPTILHVAVMAESPALVEAIFARADRRKEFNSLLKEKNNHGSGKTALRMAVEKSLPYLIRHILKYNDDPIEDPTLLAMILLNGNTEILKILIELRPNEIKNSVLYHAIENNDEDTMNALQAQKECHHLFENCGLLHKIFKSGRDTVDTLATALLRKFPQLSLELDHDDKPVLSYKVNPQIRDKIVRTIIRRVPSTDRSRYRVLFKDENHPQTPSTVNPSISEVVRELLADPPGKEISLSLSGFGSSASSAQSFLDLIRKPNNQRQADNKPGDILLQVSFEKTLISVDIPVSDLPAPQADGSSALVRGEAWYILGWLKNNKKVEGIYELRVRDSCYMPHTEMAIRLCVAPFDIEVLDWRRLDMSLSVLHAMDNQKSFTCPKLKILRLYAGGWPALAYWTSEESLLFLDSLPELRCVEICILSEFVGEYLSGSYVQLSENRFNTFKAAKPDSKLDVAFEAKSWSDLCPVIQRKIKPRDPTAVEATQLSNFLTAYGTLHREFGDDAVDGWRRTRLARRVLLNPLDEGRKHTPYIRVAIIDNGVDPGSINCYSISGSSFVPSDTGESNWWHITHSHGTKMARIITDLNPYCRLLVAKVGDSRTDFTASRVIKALNWAVAAKADIISLSLTLDEGSAKLKIAVDDAVNRGAVIIASVHGEGSKTKGAGYPASYHNVLAIASADGVGGPSSGTVEDQANYLFPGEKIVARTEHLGGLEDTPDISGPSVATAVAAGVASLVLAGERFALFQKEGFDRPEYPMKLQGEVVRKVFEAMSSEKNYVRPWMFFGESKSRPSWGEGDSVLSWISRKYDSVLTSD